MSYVKVVEQKHGNHIWFKVFVSQCTGVTMAKAGDLIFNEDEAVDVRDRLKEFADCYEVLNNGSNG